jgi:hypothetical protein
MDVTLLSVSRRDEKPFTFSSFNGDWVAFFESRFERMVNSCTTAKIRRRHNGNRRFHFRGFSPTAARRNSKEEYD